MKKQLVKWHRNVALNKILKENNFNALLLYQMKMTYLGMKQEKQDNELLINDNV